VPLVVVVQWATGVRLRLRLRLHLRIRIRFPNFRSHVSARALVEVFWEALDCEEGQPALVAWDFSFSRVPSEGAVWTLFSFSYQLGQGEGACCATSWDSSWNSSWDFSFHLHRPEQILAPGVAVEGLVVIVDPSFSSSCLSDSFSCLFCFCSCPSVR